MDGLALRDQLLDQRDQMKAGAAAFELMADDLSRATYRDVLRARSGLRREQTLAPVPDQYFPPGIYRHNPEEVFIDCGAYTGDTLTEFARRGRFDQVIAFEPDLDNRVVLEQTILGLRRSQRIEICGKAVSDRSGVEAFAAGDEAMSQLDPKGTSEVPTTTLDDYLATRGVIPTFIKMDIEGAEPRALAGARETIRKHAPFLAICVYHELEHLWQIPLAIKAIREDYRIFLRRHGEGHWESVCYALPPSYRTSR
jgi:FkbM family methyltransferase